MTATTLLTRTDAQPLTARPLVTLRALPYPYPAALAVCSDLDETPDGHLYLEIAKFLNTTRDTVIGPGIGLEVGNSIFFDMAPGEFSYRTTDDAGRAMVRALIASGHVDCLHSYGDLARTRVDAERDLAELQRHGCKLEVWVDHSKAPTNFGPDIMFGAGDVAGSDAYHADLTLDYGIRYVWRGRTTCITGQNAPIDQRALLHMLRPGHPIASTTTMLKESVKIRLGRRGHPRWKMYAANQVCRPATLRDGQPIWEFMRSNPFWGGSGKAATADGIARVLTARALDELVRRRGACVLYTHLGKVRDPAHPFNESTRRAFALLGEYQNLGRIFVTTTHRLLRYLTAREGLHHSAERIGERTVIEIGDVDDAVFGRRRPSDVELQGLTFVVPGRGPVAIRREDQTAIRCAIEHHGDATLATIPWKRLTFPDF